MATSMACTSAHTMARMSVASSSASSTSRVARCPEVRFGSEARGVGMRATFRSAHKNQIASSSTRVSKRVRVVASVANESLSDEIQKIVQAGSHRSVVKNATLEAVEGKEEAVQKLCMKWVEATNKAKEDSANGILSFECHPDAYEKGVFHFWERYTTNASMAAYNSKKEAQTFMKEVRPMLQGPIAMVLYEYSDKAGLGPMATCVGPTGEGGLDDATGGTKGSGGGIQHRQTSNALGGGLVNLEKDDRKLHVQAGGINLGKIAEKAKSLFSKNKK
eukprot:CAMPEP_0118933222 /NCGR_PEP_ID=MMETSP1169-20130426/11680_1 /TAXON_ID=36882 /ORGANISM="Pyramimonas obovata, Strain CCMP722" /LENGTH=275 /DNA_ID=CAMNT_0006875957 /DNA_START=60 /DNA_END=887 /DNA_ORIENTATION=-